MQTIHLLLSFKSESHQGNTALHFQSTPHSHTVPFMPDEVKKQFQHSQGRKLAWMNFEDFKSESHQGNTASVQEKKRNISYS